MDNDYLYIDAIVIYKFKDTFTDPLNRREYNKDIGTSDPNHPLFKDNKWTEFGGTHFDIIGEWKTRISGFVKIDK